jgi:hypothetical protein
LKKIFIINAKKFGGNATSLIFALPKRNKGSEKKGKSEGFGTEAVRS